MSCVINSANCQNLFGPPFSSSVKSNGSRHAVHGSTDNSSFLSNSTNNETLRTYHATDIAGSIQEASWSEVKNG